MSQDLYSLIFDYSKRQEMKNHPVFIKIKDIWDKGIYCTPQKTGSLNYLIKQIHETKSSENTNYIVKQPEWVNFYFESGKNRKTQEETYQTKQYYGRTIEELYSISLSLKEDINSQGFNINEQAALNIVFIKIIDDTYCEYMRDFNIIFKMKQKYPEFNFSLAKPLEGIEYGVDIIIKLNNKFISAIKVLPRSAIKNKKEIEEQYSQKHDTFKLIYDVDTYFVYSSVSGYISGELPSL